MPALRDIKKRIESVKKTGKITKAMKMVSAAKLKKAQDATTKMRIYYDNMKELIESTLSDITISHPLLEKRGRRAVELIIFTGDRGLCGAFNTNVVKEAERFIAPMKRDNINVSVNTIGKKARDYFIRRGVSPRNSIFDLPKELHYSFVKEISTDIIQNYYEEMFDEVLLIYSEFKSILSQPVISKKLLPLEILEISAEVENRETPDFIFEPQRKVLLNKVLPDFIETILYMAILESRTSEEATRMVAMENATKNTEEMVDNLTLEFNKARQASITAELMDIVGGAAALQ